MYILKEKREMYRRVTRGQKNLYVRVGFREKVGDRSIYALRVTVRTSEFELYESFLEN